MVEVSDRPAPRPYDDRNLVNGGHVPSSLLCPEVAEPASRIGTLRVAAAFHGRLDKPTEVMVGDNPVRRVPVGG
jgi:hypothetical protein